jgi:glycosyltransferase involved in cell wall biosynthesis
VVSEKTKQDVLANSSFDARRVEVIPNFVFDYFRKSENYTQRKRPVILQVGITYNKNIERVADALRGIDCELVIIGRPTELQLKILKDNCINYKCLVGLSNDEVYRQYVNCNMVMFASTLEGFGLPIIEANTVGRPVITSNMEPMISVAGDSVCMVDPYNVESIRNAVLKIMNDENYRDNLIEKGLENAKRFSVENVSGLYYGLYKRVLNEK